MLTRCDPLETVGRNVSPSVVRRGVILLLWLKVRRSPSVHHRAQQEEQSVLCGAVHRAKTHTERLFWWAVAWRCRGHVSLSALCETTGVYWYKQLQGVRGGRWHQAVRLRRGEKWWRGQHSYPPQMFWSFVKINFHWGFIITVKCYKPRLGILLLQDWTGWTFLVSYRVPNVVIRWRGWWRSYRREGCRDSLGLLLKPQDIFCRSATALQHLQPWHRGMFLRNISSCVSTDMTRCF